MFMFIDFLIVLFIYMNIFLSFPIVILDFFYNLAKNQRIIKKIIECTNRYMSKVNNKLKLKSFSPANLLSMENIKQGKEKRIPL